MDRSKFVEKVKPHEGGFLSSGSHTIGHLDIELTERCDNNCVHCSINIPENSPEQKRELNTSEWKRIIKEAADLGVLKIRFTGGEPLLRKDFSELYLFTRKLGIKVIIFTNARKITTELAKMLSEIPPLEKIEVSVYGMSRESYEKISRVPGSYEEFHSGIDLLLKFNIPFVVKGILLSDNISEKEEFESWA
ncbi:MAG: radical SAM protein, partial [Candidatus Aminicenantes bacterium]|nr:radical SAM protein [Candidatus Aminicenantes bacterium]